MGRASEALGASLSMDDQQGEALQCDLVRPVIGKLEVVTSITSHCCRGEVQKRSVTRAWGLGKMRRFPAIERGKVSARGAC